MSTRTPEPVGTRAQVTAYCRTMESFHNDGEKWLVFRLPAHSAMLRYGPFGSCRASEREDYAKDGAQFCD